ncbi:MULTISPECIES: hypothetical protein [unclassified Acinetobacter]|uniref:hypothetical protein n=1 Tax=unclassified Acinetobacter TaxID=196816 RepID=UPI00211DB2DE|nr:MULTISPECIES: hypothetical protein [unclassified Acinetobacter]
MAKFKMIEDEAQLELPEYIDEPRYVRNKAAGYGLFFLGWLAGLDLVIPASDHYVAVAVSGLYRI